MEDKLYVGNFPFSETEETLTALFSECGNVRSVKLITDRETGRSRGFGFVEMSSKEETEKAIESLDGRDWNGRTLKVNRAKPRERRY